MRTSRPSALQLDLSQAMVRRFFVLARDEESSLRARHGEILWLEESDYIERSYQMFLSCEVPVGGNGGAVVDHDGNVTGMAFFCSPHPAVLSISTIMTCIDMWLKFSCIARPIHGLGIRTIELLDVSLQEEICLDHGIDSGFIVDTVPYDSAAERSCDSTWRCDCFIQWRACSNFASVGRLSSLSWLDILEQFKLGGESKA
ncbi:hypothetical protein HU200_050324 [Digitaria exilis]|uniref:Uncharacterized protein n=1 Tax=Digitaria exilis TaxID=1010633 RepID=A0A835E994_9POAL|nr:hypothetical protein HU200_050324 [Digitaria exilis]